MHVSLYLFENVEMFLHLFKAVSKQKTIKTCLVFTLYLELLYTIAITRT